MAEEEEADEMAEEEQLTDGKSWSVVFIVGV